MNALSQPFAALILSAAVLPWMASAETPAASSNTVIGPNVMLADGADALMRGDWERALATDTDSLKWVTQWTLPLVGRQDEAIAGYREMETRALPGLIRELMKASRLVLENKKEEGLAVVEQFNKRHFDPEGIYFTAREAF